MSYILDALKRADAERERGHVPGLHSQGTPAPAAGAARPRRPGVPLMVGTIALLVAAAAALWWWRAAPSEHKPAVATMQAPASAQEKPVTSEVATVAAPAPPPPALPILAPPPAPVAVAPSSARSASIGERSPPPPTAAPPTAAAAKEPGATGTAPQSSGQHPPVSISGSTYSSNPAHRMLIVNGNVVREGQTVSPGLVLEIITPRSAVFNHNGTRFNVNF